MSRVRLRRLVWTAVVLAAVLGGAGIWLLRRYTCVRIEVRNESRAAIRELVVRVRGDEALCDELAHGDEWCELVGVATDSALTASWIDAHGTRRPAHADLYFVRGQAGDFTARINEFHQLDWEFDGRFPLDGDSRGCDWDTRVLANGSVEPPIHR